MFNRFLLRVLFAFAMVAALLGSSVARADDIPAEGSLAPAFTLPDQNGKDVRLDSLRGKWVVVYFYPKDDTPGCTKEACKFRDDYAQLSAMSVQVLGISVDETASHAAFAQKYRLPFPLLADRGGAVAKRYGALSDWGVISYARRYTFVVDPQGKIAKVYLKVNTDTHSTEVIADLKRLTGKN